MVRFTHPTRLRHRLVGHKGTGQRGIGPGERGSIDRGLHNRQGFSEGALVLRQLLIWGLACRFGSGQRAANHFIQPQH